MVILQLSLVRCKLWTRERIVIDPTILIGKLVVKGTRLEVEFVIDLLAYDWTELEIPQNYPGLTNEDIQACLSYASDLLKTERVNLFEIDEEPLSN